MIDEAAALALAELDVRYPRLDVDDLAAALGVTLDFVDRESVVCGRRVYADYDRATRRIILYNASQLAADPARRRWLLAHELFHDLYARRCSSWPTLSREDEERAAESFATKFALGQKETET